MRSLGDFRFDNTYARLHPALYEVVEPTPLRNPRLVAFNADAARLIDLDSQAANDPALIRWLAGDGRIPGSEPIALAYAGHQFGVWVPELGDGRAILLGEVVNARGARWDLHLKGAGRTRWSRDGDGRSVLRSAIREYLGGEALAGLGIPTSRALAIIGGDDVVYREVPERAATLLRLAPSHVRFGTFELLASRGLTDRVRELADYVISHHFPELVSEPDRWTRWLAAVTRRTAELIADWMAMGFAHGVLNTDNMSVLGITLDYGPFGFVDEWDPGFVPNHSDPEGRYSFGRQPAIGYWNLARFAESLLSLMTVADAEAALAAYAPAFDARYAARMRTRLGLADERDADRELVADLLGFLLAGRVDYTRFLRALSDVSLDGDGVPPELLALGGDGGALREWLARYRARVLAEPAGDAGRRARMRAANPKFVLRSWMAQEVIDRARDGDVAGIESLRRVLARPFDEHPEHEAWAGPPPAWARDLVVSCSS